MNGFADTYDAAKAAAEAWYRGKMGEGLEPQADSQSTPITPEGLRGLGFETANAMVVHGSKYTYFARRHLHGSTALKFNVYRWTATGGYFANIVMVTDGGSVDEVCLGTAPDLETVGRLIEVLRRMNGGDTCSI